MSRTALDYQSLRADLRADAAATLVRDVSEASIRSLHCIPVEERRENLLAIARAVLVADGPLHLQPPTWKLAVRYYALASDPMPAFARLLLAVRDTDSDEVDAALDRLCAA